MKFTFLNFRHRLVVRLLGIFPQIQMVALCNSRAMGEADENSDIDLFIIAKKGNLWTARFLTTLLTSMLGLRRRNTHGLKKWTPEYTRRTKDRFCLSFFITEEAMNFDSIRLQPDDPYLDRWICTLVPLINKNHAYEHFMEANGFEVQSTKDIEHSSLPLDMPVGISPVQNGGLINKSAFFLFSFFSFLSFFEWLIKKFWLPRTLRTYEKLGKPWWVVISDTMLKFHDQDVRREYLRK